MTDKTAKLTLPSGDQLELAMYSPSEGNDVIDVSKLVKSGVFTYDPGLMSTASCESKITFIDGSNKNYFFNELCCVNNNAIYC